MTTCIVLHVGVEYADGHRPFLRELITAAPDLFAVVGVAPESWEDAIDWLCIELDTSGEQPGAFCNTTSHPGESLAEVVEFAEHWCTLRGVPRDVFIAQIGFANPRC